MRTDGEVWLAERPNLPKRPQLIVKSAQGAPTLKGARQSLAVGDAIIIEAADAYMQALRYDLLIYLVATRNIHVKGTLKWKL